MRRSPFFQGFKYSIGKSGENTDEVFNVKDKLLLPENSDVRFTYMKRKLPPAAILAIALAVLALGWHFRREAPRHIARQTTSAVTEQAAPYQFLLKARNKNLELFHAQDGSWRKLAEFPITMADLPEADRRLLQAGLVLRDSQELQRSLEDYLPNQ
jgi:hypothetical protein